jgi:hypothetical protein
MEARIATPGTAGDFRSLRQIGCGSCVGQSYIGHKM